MNARRLLGTVNFELGALFESRQEFEKLLADWNEDRDKGLAAVTGADVLCVGCAYMAQLMIVLGNVEDAVRISEGAIRRAESLGDFGSLAFASGLSLFVLAMCGRIEATLRRAETFEANASEKGAGLWVSIAREWASWARGLITGDAAAAANEFRDIMAARRERQERQSAYMGHALLAELQGKAGVIEDALASIAEGLALAEQTGGHRADSFLHRVRGDILADREPAAAQAAYHEALRIAQSQGARTFELQAAHALAKLLERTGRPAEAHAILAPALEGFSPTAEMPEIGEAQALLAALADLDEVKAVEAQRERRLHLQTAYGQALMWSKGLTADDTKAAFARIGEFAGSAENAPARLVAYYAQCLRGMVRGEYGQAREIAETFLREAEAHGRTTEAAAARRMLGLILLNQGELKGARSALERALGDTISQRDGEAQFLFDWDTDGEASAAAYLALAEWHLGDLERSRQLILGAISRADKLGHVATAANVLFFKTALESRRRDVSATQQAAAALLRLTEKHGIKSFADMVQVYVNWTYGRLVDPEAGAAAIRMALAAHVVSGNKGAALSHHVLLAELEATTRNHDSALTLVGEGLAIAEETGGHLFDSYLHCLRGDILLTRNPVDLADAEEAYHTAIAVALQQGARSYGLLASLALAKLYQSTSRPADVHAVLGPALEGFAPTPEMPEIAEAQALMERLT